MMEPFIAEQGERISNTTPRNGNQGKSYALMMAMMVVVMLVISGALVAMLFFQKQSFDGLQANFQALQSKLESPAKDSATAEEPAPVSETDPTDQQPKISADVSAMGQKLSSLEKTLESLSTEIGKVEDKIPSVQVSSSGSADTRALTSSIAKANKGLNNLRQDILSIRLSLSELEDKTNAWKVTVDRRLDSSDQAIMSLNDFRRRSSSSSGSVDDQALSRIYRELELLKKQHPYLND